MLINLLNLDELELEVSIRVALADIRSPRRRSERCSLLLLTLETGRKHQIRRHLALAHHPILGDERYGPKSKLGTPSERLALHALQLSFDDPFDHCAIKLQIDPPDDFWQMGGIAPISCKDFY